MMPAPKGRGSSAHWLCRRGLHNWTPKRPAADHPDKQQVRSCRRCNTHRWRWAYDFGFHRREPLR